MYRLERFVNRIGSLGRPLPDPFPSFEFNRITFRQGQTSMIAGKPGSFKSVLALNMVATWAECNKSILYFSADSDERTVAKRMSAILTGDADTLVERRFADKDTGRYVAALERLCNVHFVYESLDMAGIASRFASFEAVYGEWPDVAFIDNLIDYADSAGDWVSQIELTKQLDVLARETRAHICILHHAKVDRDNSGRPPADYEIQGKVTQIPRLVLTCAASDMALYIACVKNTNGPQDPLAQSFMQFWVHENLAVDDISYGMETGKK